LLAATALCSAPLPAQDTLDAAAWLQKLTRATETLTYDGVFVYQREGHINAMRIVHKNNDGAEIERLVSLSGPAREVIRDGSRVTCLFADDQAVMVEKTQPKDFLPVDLSAPIDRLSKYYQFQMAGNDRVAGRTTTVINIVPNKRDRYGYRLWIDDEFGLLLRSLIVDRDGRPLEQVQFTQIHIGNDIPDASFSPEIEGTGFTWYTNAEPEGQHLVTAQTSNWHARWLPEGFEMQNYKVQHIVASDMPVSHLVYSDGLAMVSIFVEELVDGRPPLQGYSVMGAVNAFSQVAGNYQITVVGEVPLPTVRQIAASVSQSQ
jgi:sigma-E factor negative regulatory protein RseB